MKKILVALAAVIALAIPTAGTAKPTPNVACGSCAGGNYPPYTCDYWHWGNYTEYQGTWWYCTSEGGYYHWVISY